MRNLFCSVKLNVNNPHFLIMQGRVTKVINMKPVEILGLIEEAAGTSHYQNKSQQALQHLRRKDLKLAEIESIMASEVAPKLEQLNAEKNQLVEHRAIETELTRLENMIVAFKYFQLSQMAVSSDKHDELQQKAKGLKLQLRSVKKQ